MTDFAAKLIHLIHMLRRVVAEHVVACERPPQPVWLGTRVFAPVHSPSPHKPHPPATWNLLTLRLRRLANRLNALFLRWQQGRLAPPRPPAAPLNAPIPASIGPPMGPSHPPAGQAAARPPYLRLPRERGWINRRIAAAAPCAGLLGSFLQQPEAARFHAEIPGAARLLRPLCHALAVDLPPWLKLPPRRTRPRRLAPPATPPRSGWGRGQRRPRSHPAPMLPTDKPLPGYVATTATAWKKSR